MRTDYHDHIGAWRQKEGNFVLEFSEYPSFVEWIGRPDGVPGGDVFRDLFTKAQYEKGGAGPDGSIHEYRSHAGHNT